MGICWWIETVLRSSETLEGLTGDEFWPIRFQIECVKHSASVARGYTAKQSQNGEATDLVQLSFVHVKLQPFLLLLKERFCPLSECRPALFHLRLHEIFAVKADCFQILEQIIC